MRSPFIENPQRRAYSAALTDGNRETAMIACSD
jgi:hypothetical protein